MKEKLNGILTCPSCGHKQNVESKSPVTYRCEGCGRLLYNEKNHFHFINNKGENVKAYYSPDDNGTPKIMRYEKVRSRSYDGVCAAC